MKEKINGIMDQVFSLLEKDEKIVALKKQKLKLLQNDELLSQMKILRTLDPYSSEYQKLKQQLFQNSDFMRFKQLENEVDFLILAINQKLKTLTNERSCNDENY